MPSFVHLHNHSHYSLLKSVITPEQLVQKAKENGQNAVALTDVNAVYGAIEFYQSAVKEEIKPILGCELNVKEPYTGKNREPLVGHIVLLAENMDGYYQLLELVTLAQLRKSEANEPIHVTWEELKKHSKGLIFLSGSTDGLIPQLLQGGHQKETEKILQELNSWNKEAVFLELQSHPNKVHQNEINQEIQTLAGKLKLPLVYFILVDFIGMISSS